MKTALFDKSADPMCVVSRDGRLLERNAAWRTIFGQAGDAGGLWSAALRDEDQAKANALLESALAASKPGAAGDSGEAGRAVLRFGSATKPSWLQVQLTCDEASGEVYVVGHDVTAIVGEKDQLSRLLRASPAIVWAVDNEGLVTFNDGGGLAKLGFTPGSTVGLSAFDMYRDVPEVGDNLRRALNGEARQERGGMGGGMFLDTWYVPLLDEKGDKAGMMGFSLDASEAVQIETKLLERIAVIETQNEAIRTLSALVLDLWDGVLAVPVVGKLDASRAELLMERLLEAVRARGARYAVLDLTGVDSVDADTAEHLLRMCKAVGLLGTRALISGVQPAVAQTLIELGVGMGDVRVVGTLRAALAYCVAQAKRA